MVAQSGNINFALQAEGASTIPGSDLGCKVFARVLIIYNYCLLQRKEHREEASLSEIYEAPSPQFGKFGGLAYIR